jgi:hypothetical protein
VYHEEGLCYPEMGMVGGIVAFLKKGTVCRPGSPGQIGSRCRTYLYSEVYRLVLYANAMACLSEPGGWTQSISAGARGEPRMLRIMSLGLSRDG